MIDYDRHRWWHHFFDIRGSMLPEITGRVVMSVVWATGVVLFHDYIHPVEIPATIHSLTGIALGLLLVFRTNSANDRYWEGRKLWGGIVNESRNLCRLAKPYFGTAPYEEICRWTVAFAYASMHSLRGERGLGPVAARLPEEQVRAAVQAQHVPLAVAGRITGILAEGRHTGRYDEVVHMAIDRNLTLLMDYIGGCERIRKTPLPFAYVVHLRRALILYCFSLPVALVQTMGTATILAVFITTFLFFGIEEIGVEIEDPFGTSPNDLPLRAICATIEGNLLALAGQGASSAEVD